MQPQRDHSEILLRLITASGRNRSEIPDENLYRDIGFDGENPRLGWVIPPTWDNIENILTRFLNLKLVKRKTNFIFSGMGGSINAIKAITVIHEKPTLKIYTIDNLDPDALTELLSQVDSLERTLVLGVSKSGTTTETRDILNALSQRFEYEGLNSEEHFLWLTDITPKKQSTDDSDLQSLPIQLNRRTDIGGRFSAPHTAIFLIPLFLALNQDLKKLHSIWTEYLRLREAYLDSTVNEANNLTRKDTEKFAIYLDEPLAQALETWSTQLIQESLGSKIPNYNPKTIVLRRGEASPPGFEPLMIDVESSDIDVKLMVCMYLLQVFTAIFAYEKGINFVNQPDVELYKRAMNLVDQLTLPTSEPVTYSELIAKIGSIIQVKPGTRFLEVICYWHLRNDVKEWLRKRLRVEFPEMEILVFTGSDWNHHSYQAASRSKNTIFILLTKSNYEQKIEGISKSILENNIDTLRTIAYATQQTLKDKAILLTVNDANFIS
jgi:hypothetical protein